MSKVVITGINGGIGRALAKEFQSRGLVVVGVDLAASGPEDMDYYQLDVTEETKALATYQAMHETHPDIAYWCNNAGIAVLGPFLDVSMADFNKVMAVNLTAVVTATRFWLRVFNQQGGCVINMASAAGLIPSGDMSSYVASKHAIIGFTRAIQLELDAEKSFASTCLVVPGFVQTGIMQVGSKYGLPEKIKGIASSPEACAEEIVAGVLRGEREIIPTLSGKVMTGLYRYLPFGHALAAAVYQKSRTLK
jgi:short-subunit dehydrogenase